MFTLYTKLISNKNCTTYVIQIPQKEAVSLFNDILLLSSERFHLGLLPQLVQMLLVFEYRHGLDIARANCLLFGLLVTLDSFARPTDPWLVPVRTLRLVRRV